MSPTPNWSMFRADPAWPSGVHPPYAISIMVHGLPAFLQPEVLIGRPSRSLHICSLIWFCPSPEPGSNSGMPPHDHAVLNGTVRGYAIVSREVAPEIWTSR